MIMDCKALTEPHTEGFVEFPSNREALRNPQLNTHVTDTEDCQCYFRPLKTSYQKVANPATTPPSQIATLSTVDFYQAGITTSGVGTVADPSLEKEFLMSENTAGTWAYGLARYDLNTYLPEALLQMPASASSVLAQWTMFRWGQDGLAMLSYADFGLGQPVVVVTLLRGPFVAPQLLQTNSAASLASSSTLTHGSGNTMLTLTGANFLPGVDVTWNGNYRTTTRVDATHVTVAIPASDLSNTGTVSVVATNPGATGSNALQITIN